MITLLRVLSSPSQTLRRCPGSSSGSESGSTGPDAAPAAEEGEESTVEGAGAGATSGEGEEGTTSWGIVEEGRVATW